MPANFPEVWLGRIIQNLTKADLATFLDGIPEIAADVTQINKGEMSEMNKIYVPSSEFSVDVLINNTAYPLDVQVYADGTIEITLDKFQTKVTTLSDDAVIGASYDKIDQVTKSHIRAILVAKFQKALHSIAPAGNTANTPVLKATGGAEALTDDTGRLILTYEDLVAAKRRCKGFGQCRLVLTNNHWNDLLLDRKNFGNQLVDYAKGKPNPVVAGFQLHEYEGAFPLYTAAGAKKAYGAIPEVGDTEASVIFVAEAIGKKTGITTQYFDKPTARMQANELAYRHYYIAVPFQAAKIGAIRE